MDKKFRGPAKSKTFALMAFYANNLTNSYTIIYDYWGERKGNGGKSKINGKNKRKSPRFREPLPF